MCSKKKQNKYKTLLQQLFFLKFAINVKNQFKIFKKFFVRFISIINFLRLLNNNKIIHFYKNLFNQLTKKIYYFNNLIKYSKYVKNVR